MIKSNNFQIRAVNTDDSGNVNLCFLPVIPDSLSQPKTVYCVLL